MTPKEKAKALVHKIAKKIAEENLLEYSDKEIDDREMNCAKECALIAVDEILQIGNTINNLPLTETKIMLEAYPKFWQQVKEEILNL